METSQREKMLNHWLGRQEGAISQNTWQPPEAIGERTSIV